MATARKIKKKKTVRKPAKSQKCIKSAIITVRISDDEKNRIGEIMMTMDIKRYSDVMRMALHMLPQTEYTHIGMQ